MNNESYALEKELLVKQEEILSKEEIFWRKKSWDKWLDEGDWNTIFFHNSTIHNRSKNKIKSITNHLGVDTNKPQEIADTFVAHFQGLLNNYEGSNIEVQ